MDITPLHDWKLPLTEAAALQKELAKQLIVDRPLKKCKLIAGADCSYNKFSTTMYAAVVVLRLRDLTIVETQGVVGEATFPYVPGFLSFREIPILIQAFAKLEHRPDVVMLDGQGIAHPRRMGIASHVGLWLKIPCFGCGKSKLCGNYDEPGPNAGDYSPLLHYGNQIGAVLRTKPRTKPVFISPGHLIDLESSIRLTLKSGRGYRIPEPTRQAHLHVNVMRVQAGEASAE